MEMPYHPSQIKQLRAQYNGLSDHFFPYLRADLATSNKKPSVTAAYQNSRLFSLTEKKNLAVRSLSWADTPVHCARNPSLAHGFHLTAQDG